MKRIVSGIQPTNSLTIGNFLGSIKQLIKLQDTNELIIFVADLHAITTGYQNPEILWKNRRQIVKYYLAAGLDPNKVTIFYQSDVLAHTMLEHLFICNTTIGELNRMTQFKDKSQKALKQDNGTEMIPTGLLIYPTLMAADILLYNPDLVPVGQDQKQHLELTRNIAIRFNNKYKKDLFKIPEPMIPVVGAKIMDLQNPLTKMSKSSDSKKGVIFLDDSIEDITKKIKSAVTDNLNEVKYDYENQPGVANLINLYAAIANVTIQETENEFKNQNYGTFKNKILDVLIPFIIDFQNKLNQIDEAELDKITTSGSKKAIQFADDNLYNVMKAMGFK